MADFKIIFYITLVMFTLLTAVFAWGWITYNKVKTTTKFLNKPLLTLTVGTAIVGMITTLIPIFMAIWKYDSVEVKADPVFITVLVFEFIFLAAFLVLAYLFAYDFGIALDKENNKLQFFGQTINTNKIIALEEKKYTLKIVYEQGFKNMKKKLIIITPKAKLFVKEALVDIVSQNQKIKANMQEYEEKTIEIETNIENS